MTEEYMRRDVNFNTIHATNEKHFDIFFEILNINEGQRLLDIGGGYGEIAFEFFKRNKDTSYYYHLLDPCQQIILLVLYDQQMIQDDQLNIQLI